MTRFTTSSRLSRRVILKAAGAAAAGLAAPALIGVRSAYADYPDRPIKFVVANTPGGPSDIVARIVTAALEQSTGKTFVVDNRGGAGGNIGMEYVAHSDPDGYTILLATNAVSVNVGLYNHLPFDPYKDFVGVSELATSPNTFVVKSELPAKTMKDFVALARDNPDKYNCATPPIGTTRAAAARSFSRSAKICRNSRMSCSRAAATPSRRCSAAPRSSARARWRRLCRTSSPARCAVSPSAPPTRWPDLPDVPTMEESGYKDFVFAVDCVLLAPAKTPPANVKWLEAETLKVLKTPEMKDKLYKAGFLVRPQGADAAWARVTKEIAMFKQIIDQAGIAKM